MNLDLLIKYSWRSLLVKIRTHCFSETSSPLHHSSLHSTGNFHVSIDKNIGMTETVNIPLPTANNMQVLHDEIDNEMEKNI